MTTTLAQKPKTQKRGRPQSRYSQQLDLLGATDTEPPTSQPLPKSISAKLAPASHHRTVCDRYWIVVTRWGGQYGGLFYRAEIDYILEHFSDRTGPIESDELDRIAERAVAKFTNRAGAAS